MHHPSLRTTTTATRIRTVAVVGLGYVGLPLALLAHKRGYTVRGFDIDQKKIDALRRRHAPYLSEEEARAFRASTLELGDDQKKLEGVDAFIICVPTPVDESHQPDLAPLEAASMSVARHLAPGALVVVESTVSPGACERSSLAILERISGLTAERDFFFAHCPERINPGDTKWDVRTIPRVVGGKGPKSLARARALYRSLIDAPIVAMGSIEEAEAVKMVENSFRDVNIAFVNELAMSFGRAGIDIMHVLEGAATKPFAFMPHTPGCGVGGHCIPVDPYYLIRYGRQNGFEHRFLATAREINNGMPRYTVDLLEATLGALTQKTVALLGLAYKRDVPDLRESPALAIRDELRERGAHIRVFDPLVPGMSDVPTLAAALSKADAAIIATDHSIFRSLTPDEFLARGVGVVIDGRNCLPKEAFAGSGVTYRGIGR